MRTLTLVLGLEWFARNRTRNLYFFFRDVIFCIYIFGCIYGSVLIFVLDRQRIRLRSEFVLLQQPAFLWWMLKRHLQSSRSQRQESVCWRQNWQWNVIIPRAHVSKVIDYLMLLIEHTKLSLLNLHYGIQTKFRQNLTPAATRSPHFTLCRNSRKRKSLESFIVIFVNSFLKGFSWQNMRKSEISVLTASSRYSQSAALKWKFFWFNQRTSNRGTPNFSKMCLKHEQATIKNTKIELKSHVRLLLTLLSFNHLH